MTGRAAFASRGVKDEWRDEDLQVIAPPQPRFPLVSCSAAKALVCIGGIAAVGEATYRSKV